MINIYKILNNLNDIIHIILWASENLKSLKKIIDFGSSF